MFISMNFKFMKVKIVYLILFVLCMSPIVGMGLASFGADSKTDLAIQRDLALQESIRKMEATRNKVREEVILAKQELNALKQEIANLRGNQGIVQETNQVIIVKIILPSTARPVTIQAEKE
jgi:uncharacterized protein YlxW (UPF0749 family)